MDKDSAVPPTKPTAAKPKRERKPTIFDEAREAARRGDLPHLINEFSGFSRLLWKPEMKSALIEQALRTLHSRGGVGLAVKAMLDEVLLLDSQILANAHIEVRARMYDGEIRDGTRTAAAKVPTEMLDRLSRIEERFLSVSRQASTVMHTFALAGVPVEQRQRSGKVVRIDDAGVPEEQRHAAGQ